jgi:hypothetical protein
MTDTAPTARHTAAPAPAALPLSALQLIQQRADRIVAAGVPLSQQQLTQRRVDAVVERERRARCRPARTPSLAR